MVLINIILSFISIIKDNFGSPMFEFGSEEKINHLMCFEEGRKWLWLINILRKSRLKISFSPKVKLIARSESLRSFY
jgi:hypothetical protein